MLAEVYGGVCACGQGKNLSLAHGGNTLSVSDGTYAGHYNGFRWSNTVEVTVQDHEMITIRQTKPQVFAKEETVKRWLTVCLPRSQRMWNAVSGATADSNAFFAALEDALTP